MLPRPVTSFTPNIFALSGPSLLKFEFEKCDDALGAKERTVPKYLATLDRKNKKRVLTRPGKILALCADRTRGNLHIRPNHSEYGLKF